MKIGKGHLVENTPCINNARRVKKKDQEVESFGHFSKLLAINGIDLPLSVTVWAGLAIYVDSQYGGIGEELILYPLTV